MSIIDEDGLQSILTVLQRLGYTTVGPQLHNGAIIYDEISGVGDLPRGWNDEQQPGSYSLNQHGEGKFFAYVVGPHSWKKFLFPPRKQLFTLTLQQAGFEQTEDSRSGHTVPKYAFIGVRPCELQAIAIQDKVFCSGECIDSSYSSLRRDVFILAVNCTRPGENCFCSSMNTGPKAGKGFDLLLTEITSGDKQCFILEVGSKLGGEVVVQIPHQSATAEETAIAETALQLAAEQMGKELSTENIQQLLYESHDNPLWDDVAKRCLACANCTMVCPTCFCSTVEDVTDLSGKRAERWKRWDSCFTVEYARVAGGNFRSSAKSRYRQWITHKLGSWIDQFGTSGCVGCGRCITWCPVGIDITEEVNTLRKGENHPMPYTEK